MLHARPSLFTQGYFAALYILSFSIPLLYNMQSVAIILLALFWLLSGQYRNLLNNIRSHGFVLWWVLIFTLGAFSLLYTDNTETGLNDLGRKLSFLLLPLLIGGSDTYEEKRLHHVYGAYVLGTVCSALICIIHAATRYNGKEITVFFYDDLPYLTNNNAVFAAWKCFLALVLVLFYPFRYGSLRTRRVMRSLVFFLLFTFFILLSSKTLIVFGVASLFIVLLYRLIRREGRMLANLVPLLLIAGMTWLLFNVNGSPLKKRYQDVTSTGTRDHVPYDIAQADNFAKRMSLWKAAWENYTEQRRWITGNGTGDVQDLQDRKLADPDFHYKNYYNIQSLRDLNTHNMYLQTLLGTGLLGLAALLGLMLSGLWFGLTWKKYIPFIFFLVSFFFLAQESALQIQSGIVYLSFFACVWANYYRIRFPARSGTEERTEEEIRSAAPVSAPQ